MTSVRVDCDQCIMRGPGCHDCVVSVLLGGGEGGVLELAEEEQRALRVLADEGLVPPLRLVVPEVAKGHLEVG